MESFQEAAVLD